jgi:hypothetical protein
MSVDWAAHASRVVEALGEDVTYTPVGGSPRTVRVGWVVSPQDLVVQDVSFATDQPRVITTRAAVPNPQRGDLFVIAGITWRVREISPHEPERTVTLDLERPN